MVLRGSWAFWGGFTVVWSGSRRLLGVWLVLGGLR